MSRRRRVWATLAMLLATVAATAEELSVSVEPAGEEWLRPRGELRLTFGRAPLPAEGRLAVLVGSTDATDLFERRGTTWRYRSETLPLPSGEQELVVYLVLPSGEWREVARHGLRVLTRGGVERATLSPRADLSIVAQVAEGHRPEDAAPERRTFEEATLRLGLDGELERSGWVLGERFEVVGVSDEPLALRFGELGEDAPQVDLASYWLGIRRSTAHGDVALELGHVSWSGNRFLASLSNRGLLVSAPIGRAVSVSAVAANGSSIVGWDNPFGLDDGRHRIVGVGATFELLAERPGGLRLSASAIDGSLLPLADYNRGEVTDSEESRGLGFDLEGASASQRLRFSASWAQSRFVNPFDPLLAQGSDLVPVAEENRQARSASLELDLVRGRPLGERSLDLTLALRHERVEPQYRSVAAFGQADLEQDSAELRGQIGVLSLQLSGSRSRDNLDDLASILTTKTERQAASLGLPLGELLGGSPAWPQVSYSLDRTHQFGAGIPLDSGFNASHVPDQLSTSQSWSLDWLGASWTLSYRLSLSDQDNRQPGREAADFASRTQGLSLGLMPHGSFDLGFDVDREVAESLEVSRRDETLRYGAHFAWRLPGRTSFSGQWSQSDSEDDPLSVRSASELVDATWSWDFGREGPRHGFGSQLYLRYSAQDFDSRDTLFGFVQARRNWTLTAGFNLSLH